MRALACLLLVLLAALPACPSPVAASPSATARTFSARAFFETRAVGLADPAGLAFSPDGSRLLMSSDASGVANAYALPVRGGRPVALTTGTADPMRPLSYFPTDERLLLGADRGGDERSHIFVRETDGRLHDLTPGDAVRAVFLGWSADRHEFRILSNARDEAAPDLYAVDARTYRHRLLLRSDGRDIVDVSADGRWALVADRVGPADSNLYLADLRDGGPPRLITPHRGKVLHEGLGFTPDSAALLYSSDAASEFAQAWRYDLARSAATLYLESSWDVAWVRLSPSGRYRASAVNADGRTVLTIVDTRTGASLPLVGAPRGNIGQIRFSPDECHIAFTADADTSPNDIFFADLADGRVRRLTRSLNPAMAEADLVAAQSIRIRAADGLDIPALLYRPRRATAGSPAPAVVWVHGGPDQSRHGYAPTIQHLVNHGYVVLAPNFRGSLGYGKTFFHLDDRAHGEADLNDVVAAGDWLRRQPWVARDRVAVMGRSYGGFLAVAAMAFRPQAFEAGIDIFGVTNWERTLKAIPPWWESFRRALYEEMGDPATDGERLRRISPLFHAHRISRPLLVVQGANDPRVLKAESDQLVEAVRANGTPVDYLLFPDEGHGFQRRDNLIRAQEAYLAFLDRRLRGVQGRRGRLDVCCVRRPTGSARPW